MINSLLFEGYLVSIKCKNSKGVMEFVLEQPKKRIRATIRCYKQELFKIIKQSLGERVIIKGDFQEVYVSDNKDWKINYLIRCKEICKNETKGDKDNE